MRRFALAASIVGAILGALTPCALHAQEGDRVGFRAELSADTVYVGQQITYALSVRIPSEVRQRLRRNPEFVPPDPRAMLAYDLPLARTADPEAAIEVHTFRRALFVLTAGRYSIGSARLTYALPQSTSFFSREEERTLRSDAVSFVAIDPPTRGRPTGWLGAVGRWTASARAEPAVTRVGDPFVLVLRLEGDGNATLLPRPAVQIAWADIVSQDERVVLDSAPAQLGGVKEYRWLVTPRVPGLQSVPALEYPYFDPVARQYVVSRSSPIAVSVRPGTLVEVPTRAAVAADSVPLPLRAQLDGPALVRAPGGVLWMWLALIAPLPWLVRRTAPLVRRRAKAAAPVAADTARALLESGLRARTGLDLASFTTPGSLSAALRLEGVTLETAVEAESLRDACDEAGFAAQRAPGAAALMRSRAEALLARVDREARRRIGALVLLVLVAACAARDGDPAGALAAFAAGRTAYLGQDYAQSRAAFRRAATAAPRDPATWANFGTAAWQAKDTASAVYGWQRALRLDPTDRELRERLARVRAPQHRGAARVWPVAPLPVAALALLLWAAAWAWAYRRAREGRGARGPFVLLVPALALAALAARLEYGLAARDVVVVAEPTPLRALPALGSDLGAMPMKGEVARVLERRGVWLRVALDGGREGWYPTERTWSLARD